MSYLHLSISSVPDQNTGQNSEAPLQVSKGFEFRLREGTLRVQAQFGYIKPRAKWQHCLRSQNLWHPLVHGRKGEEGRQGVDHNTPHNHPEHLAQRKFNSNAIQS